jgi:hypothetical protein
MNRSKILILPRGVETAPAHVLVTNRGWQDLTDGARRSVSASRGYLAQEWRETYSQV